MISSISMHANKYICPSKLYIISKCPELLSGSRFALFRLKDRWVCPQNVEILENLWKYNP